MKPDVSQVAYGPDARHRLDLWRARSGSRTPLVIFIHGGGWKDGDKISGMNLSSVEPALQRILDSGISFATINYRFTSAATPLPAPLFDAARAVQFLRYKAYHWGLEKTRFAAFGASAGGCSALFLAFHRDLADPKAVNPIERESTRLCCVAGINAQTSIYPPHVRDWIGAKALEHAMIAQAFGPHLSEHFDHDDNNSVYHYCSPITHLDRTSPPTYLLYENSDCTTPCEDTSHAIHHPMYGYKLHEVMIDAGLECWLQIGVQGKSDHPVCQDYLDFLIDKLSA